MINLGYPDEVGEGEAGWKERKKEEEKNKRRAPPMDEIIIIPNPPLCSLGL